MTCGSKKYCCIECGHPNESLYRGISPDNIRITRCEKCFQVVDKYIECEPVQTCLDAVLHKGSAYRHLIYNSEISFMRKLCFLYLMCDMYANWQQLKLTLMHEEPISEGHLMYLFLITLCEWILYYGGMCLLLVIFNVGSEKPLFYRQSSGMRLVTRALVLSSFGKLFAIPALIWPNMGGPMCRLLITGFLASSNIVALRAASITEREALLPLAVTTSCLLKHQIHNYFIYGTTFWNPVF